MENPNDNAAKILDSDNSFDEAIKKGKWKALASAYLGWLFDCWDLMVLSLAVPLLIDAFHLSLAEAGLLSSATLVGAALGAYAWGPISDKYGRKKTLATCLIAFGALTVLSIFAQTYNHLLLLRVFTGFALGGEWALGATMVSEFFEAEHRGKANSLVQSAWPIGFFCVLGIQYYFVPMYGWKALFASGVVTILGGLWIAVFANESPMWLKSQADKKAKPVSGPVSPQKDSRWVSLFSKENRKITIIGALIMIFHSIAYWGVGSWLPAYLSKELGLGIQKSVVYLVIYNVGGLIGYGVCGYIADKWGRKYASYVGGIGSAVAIILWMNASSPTMAYIMGAFSGFFNYGYFGTLGAFLAEQFSTKIRGSALAFTYGSGRAFAGISPLLLGSIAQATSLKVALMVTACFYVLMAGTVSFLKETKGLALKD